MTCAHATLIKSVVHKVLAITKVRYLGSSMPPPSAGLSAALHDRTEYIKHVYKVT
jgi:hypothetical protein